MAERQDSFSEAADLLCEELKKVVLSSSEAKRGTIQEIRLRAGKPLTLTDGTASVFLDHSGRILYSVSEKAVCVSSRQVFETFRRLCGYSVYSVEHELKNGFLTVRGGHRVGICGTAVVSGEEVTAVSDISSLNIRIAREVTGAANELIRRLYPFRGGILLVGAPSSGKTTMLRDLARQISLGENCRMLRTVVIDERGELSGTYHGTAYNDLGLCDILNGYPKGQGVMHAIRGLSPQAIVCDEVGTEEDCRMISEGFHTGAMMICSIHAPDYESLMLRPQARKLLQTGAFSKIVMLENSDRPCNVSEIREVGKGMAA